MKYVIILLAMFCIFLINYTNMDSYENFYSELNKQAETLNDRIDRILYVKILQEGDTLYFISKDLEDSFWITVDTSWIFWDTNIPDRRFSENHR